MTLILHIQERSGFYVGQRVRATERHMMLYKRSKIREGVICNFCRGTEARVKFDSSTYSIPIDERFIEAIE